MMAMMTLKEICYTVITAGSVGGGALTLNALHEPAGSVEKVKTELAAELDGVRGELNETTGELQAELRVDRIFSLAREARDNGSPAWLCDILDKELVRLCTDEPSHYLCDTSARQELKAKAGC